MRTRRGSRDMPLTTIWQVFLTGLAGGFLLELMHWYTIRKSGRWPAYGKRPEYWILSALMAVAGGGIAVLYFGARAEGIVALHVGVSAPLILQKFSTTIASTPGAKGLGNGLMSFFDW
jgi:hypothetical protein